tara:strand:+ start:33 stop:305 length:273 start_codon:yes stop_codon:yes gene_type:complete
MPRNSYRSHNGRSGIARRALFSATGKTDGTMPLRGYFGGDKKGGAPPSATGFMTASGSRAATQIAASAHNRDYLFIFRSNYKGTRLTYLK